MTDILGKEELENNKNTWENYRETIPIFPENFWLFSNNKEGNLWRAIIVDVLKWYGITKKVLKTFRLP